jgi:hypothetical protein
VGPQVALQHTIVATQSLQKFENGRQFACHAGVARLFESKVVKDLGKSSNRANKKLKNTPLITAALLSAAVRKENLDHFERKVAEGKTK